MNTRLNTILFARLNVHGYGLFILLVAFGVGGINPFAVSAQVPTDQDKFSDEISILEIEVPVQVTKRGVPVEGLEKEQFRITVGGKERRIIGFEERRYFPTTGQVGGELDLGSEPQFNVPRSFLLVFDATTQNPRRMDQWVSALQERFANSANHDHFGVVIKGKLGYGVVSPLSADRTLNNTALDVVAAAFGADAHRLAEAEERLRTLLQATPGARQLVAGPAGILGRRGGAAGLLAIRPDDDLGIGLAEAADYGSWFLASKRLIKNVSAAQVIDLADSLAAIAQHFKEALGDRHLLLLSAGPKHSTLTTMPDLTDPGSGSVVRRAAEQLFVAFQESGWRIQGLPLGPGFNPGLFFLAEETGGRVYENFNIPEQLIERVDTETSLSYVLTFQLGSDERDGKRHKLKVRIKGLPRGARVSHRLAYFATGPRPAKELEERPVRRNMFATTPRP